MTSVEKQGADADCRVELGATLVIGDAGALHAQLSDVLDRIEPVVLDAAAVTRVDTVGLQLLQAFVDARDRDERAWRWTDTGAELHEAARQLGLVQTLKLPVGTRTDDC